MSKINSPPWEQDAGMILSPFLERSVYRMKGVKEKSFVYFIEALGLNRVKIGLTGNIKNRIRDLSVASPVHLKILVMVYGDDYSEEIAHSLFRNERIKGEWFEYSDRLKNMVRYLDNYMRKNHRELINNINTSYIDKVTKE